MKLPSNKYLDNIHYFYSPEFKECGVEQRGWTIPVPYPLLFKCRQSKDERFQISSFFM
jgi:hypothetical protein